MKVKDLRAAINDPALDPEAEIDFHVRNEHCIEDVDYSYLPGNLPLHIRKNHLFSDDIEPAALEYDEVATSLTDMGFDPPDYEKDPIEFVELAKSAGYSVVALPGSCYITIEA